MSKSLFIILISSFTSFGFASIDIPIYLTAKQNHGAQIGVVTVSDSDFGLLLTPKLKGLPSGTHGFHVHTNASCGNEGKDAGGHFDPNKSGKHLGPYNNLGHLGDLPVLIVDKNGEATLPLLAPRLDVSDLKQHAIMIHAGGDNYSDLPKKLGGGGARIACGVVK